MGVDEQEVIYHQLHSPLSKYMATVNDQPPLRMDGVNTGKHFSIVSLSLYKL
jgi:hypothetical protein